MNKGYAITNTLVIIGVIAVVGIVGYYISHRTQVESLASPSEESTAQETKDASEELSMDQNKSGGTPSTNVPPIPQESSYTVADIDAYGEKLAQWSNKNHFTIEINGKEINHAGANAGGYSNVFWKSPAIEPLSKATEELFKSELEFYVAKLEEFRTNLAMLIKTSSCDKKMLSLYIVNLDLSLTSEKLAKDLNCLGDFSFTPVVFGSY